MHRSVRSERLRSDQRCTKALTACSFDPDGRASSAWIAALAAFAVTALLAAGAPLAQEDQARKGELVFNIGGCTSCHTAKDGARLAGGDPIRSPYGTFHAPNITPDRETGIGGWSEADFIRAMREGVSPDGMPYYPAFPYTSYTQMSDEDLKALKAYLDTIPPVRQASRPHELSFPYNLRFGLRPWRWAFFTPQRFVPDPAKDPVWNRGAYLVNGPGHCQQCHTPRSWAGALDEARAFMGADLGPGIGKAPNITPHPEHGLGKWVVDDYLFLLSDGVTPDGDSVSGDMVRVVNNATSKLPPSDQDAIVAYLRSLPPR